MIITISGEEGSGKSTLAHGLAEALGYRFYSMGDIRKKYALEHGMTLEELNDLRTKDTKSDDLVDEYQTELGKKEDNFVLDSRMGFFFVPNAVKIFVIADIDARAERVFEDIKGGKRPFEPFLSAGAVKTYLQKRNRSDIEVYERLYHVNPYVSTHYDLIVDSTHMSAEQKLKHVLDWLRKKGLMETA
jgi:CMP/dCMP kinase